MPNITLADNSVKSFADPISIIDVARSISASLANSALAGKIDGKLVDASYIIQNDCSLFIITDNDADSLSIIRHSTAHLLAQAVKILFPNAQVTIGPVIDDGFYYDFAYAKAFTPEDLQHIEDKMYELAQMDYPIVRREISREEAITYFQHLGEEYKAKIIKDIPPGEIISLYKQGNFEDLCRGPHVPSTKFLRAFKLTKVAGAYWRGNAHNEMLQRIYGTAWHDKKSLQAYLNRLDEAERRDHRKLGKFLNLFHFQDIAPGMVFWHPKGWTIYRLLEQNVRERLIEFGYEEIRTPQLMDKILWEKSGHWSNFRNEMFITETENREYAIKPMSCPCHVQIYNQRLHSYRDLPVRYFEFGNCHRCEPSGALHGLMRVRNMIQDDGHIFCTEKQIQNEVVSILKLIQLVYADFGFKQIKYRLALRPEQRVGNNADWDQAEDSLRQAMSQNGLTWIDAPGEGAFYGPKIECSLADCLGRMWQCGTIQVDFSMPKRLDAQYVAEDNSRKIPVMLHRAILGSIERFMGILIEHYAGKLPLWIAPIQAMVLTISEKQNTFAQQFTASLQAHGIRSKLDTRNEKIGFKIREHSLQKIPYLLIIGETEMANHTVRVRTQEGQDLGLMDLNKLCIHLGQEVANKSNIKTRQE